MAKIIFIRHGDAVNGKNKFHGLVDEPLTDKGRDEAKKIDLKEHKPTQIITSAMARAADTGKIIADKHGIPVSKSKALNPLDLGNFVGKETSEANTNKLRNYLQNTHQQIPNGESVNKWAQKFLPFLEKHFKSTEGTIVFVTHGRNIVLAKAYHKAGAHSPKFDKKVLSDNTQSTEHGGMSILDKNGFKTIDGKKVIAGQS